MRLSQVILASLLSLMALGVAGQTDADATERQGVNGATATEGAATANEGAAAAEEAPRIVCTSGDSQRVIEVVYNNPEQSLPCEVRYQKDGAEETLWRAQNEEGFCEQQAQEFAADQEQWGWECDEAQDAGAPAGDIQGQ